MDLAKFVSLLEKQALFFCRADKLGDPFEGALPKANLCAREGFALESAQARTLVDLLKKGGDTNRKIRRYVMVNSWHVNPHESRAMWQLYGRSRGGLAIQSTFGKLASAFEPASKDVRIGTVRYDEGMVNEFNLLARHLWKRASYEYEHELRALIFDMDAAPMTADGITDLDYDNGESGRYVPVNLERLIEAVIVSPLARPWFNDVLSAILRKYGMDSVIRPSTLLDDPHY